MNAAPEPMRFSPIYAVGDIHGRLDLLEKMIEHIRADAHARSGTSLTVTLGDYVDRGPDSRGVIERLRTNPFPNRYVALKGNHEALLEAFLIDPSTGTQWQHLGGLETLRSFGIEVKPSMIDRDYEIAAEKLRQLLSPEQRAFLASLKTYLTVDRYFFCHAGVRPDVPLDRQNENDLLWIRNRFLNSTVNFGKIIVHGHTPVTAPEVLPNQINVDTGAFATGRLTCIVLEDDSYRFIST
jgi:diadenosine tetraphosphatase ApaH/serine/threonine PP2A family protein phosphatase